MIWWQGVQEQQKMALGMKKMLLTSLTTGKRILDER